MRYASCRIELAMRQYYVQRFGGLRPIASGIGGRSEREREQVRKATGDDRGFNSLWLCAAYQTIAS